MATEKPRVLFLCANNAARSQMAEALLRHAASDRFEACSAGLEPNDVHPAAIQVLAEQGVDTHGLRAKSVREFLGGRGVRVAVMLCEEEGPGCPRIYPFATQTLRWPMPNPLESHEGGEQEGGEQIDRFRAVRDDISRRLTEWLSSPGAAQTIRA